MHAIIQLPAHITSRRILVINCRKMGGFLEQPFNYVSPSLNINECLQQDSNRMSKVIIKVRVPFSHFTVVFLFTLGTVKHKCYNR